MAMMARMRSLAPAFIITVGALFVLFMVISDSNVLEALGGRTNTIGSVDGEDVSYQEFMKLLDQQRENRRAQTGEDIPEESMDQLREQIWDAIVTQKLLARQIERFGITVSDKEIEDEILGPNPPEFLKQSFIDSLGNFNRELYEQALFDPRNREPLIAAEEVVRQTKLNEKLQSIVSASVTISEEEIKRKFIEQNTNINVQYAFLDLLKFPDTTINVTDNDLKTYYNKNLDKYKIEAQRKLKYALFPNNPTADDSAIIRRSLENIADNFIRDTLSFEDIVEMYSSLDYEKDTISLSTLPLEAADHFYEASVGSIIGPVATPQGYSLYHLTDVIPGDGAMVRARHILISQFEDDAKNLEEAEKIYNRLIAGENFEQLAKEFSKDPSSAVKGGDLGWFGKGAMVPEFEKASFEGKIGVIQKPVKTSYGYHIIQVTGKSDKKYVVEYITNPITASATTKDAVYNSANDFSYLADKNGFEKEAELMNHQIQETTPFMKNVYAVPVIGVNKRIIDFAFDNKLNAVGPAFKIPTGYVVVQISEVIKEGVKPFDEVKEEIKPLAIREKKYEKAKIIMENLKKQIGNDLDKAPSMEPLVVFNTSGNFTPSGSIPNVGRDFNFIAKALELDINKISDPINGQRGYYLIKVIERTPFDSTAYSAQRNSLRDNLMQEKKNFIFNQWLNQLKKDAKIVDNRHLFFGY